MIDKKLLDILVCPQCKKDLVDKQDHLDCPQCKLAFPVKDDIPILLIDEATPL